MERKSKEGREKMSKIENKIKYLGNEIKYLMSVLNSKSWTNTEGSWTGNLEKEFAKKMGTKHGIAFNSGTSTLHAALEAVGVKAGDEVKVVGIRAIPIENKE